MMKAQREIEQEIEAEKEIKRVIEGDKEIEQETEGEKESQTRGLYKIALSIHSPTGL